MTSLKCCSHINRQAHTQCCELAWYEFLWQKNTLCMWASLAVCLIQLWYSALSPFLFILHTSYFRYNTNNCHLHKFPDDTDIVGCVPEGSDLKYRMLIMDLVSWCTLNYLHINTSKTKKTEIDFHKKILPQTYLWLSRDWTLRQRESTSTWLNRTDSRKAKVVSDCWQGWDHLECVGHSFSKSIL